MTRKRLGIVALVLFALFALLTVAVQAVDVQPIGPEGSRVGFASMNAAVHSNIGVSMGWYELTEATGIVAILSAAAFAVLGAWQLITRRSLRKVDADLYLLAGCYALTLALYAAFEIFVVNYRPVILDSGLEASYPSSHAMLTLCLMGTAAIQFSRRIQRKGLRTAAVAACWLIAALTVAGRLLSGVHWFTDILGGVVLGAALVCAYAALVKE